MRAGRAMVGAAALAAGAFGLTMGPLAGSAGAEEVCTNQLGITDPVACVGVNSSFGGLLVVLLTSEGADTVVLAGATCTVGEAPTYVVYSLPGQLLGTPLSGFGVDTTIPC